MEHDLQMFCSLVLGIFEKIFEQLSAESDFTEFGSTFVKAHKAAAGAKKGL